LIELYKKDYKVYVLMGDGELAKRFYIGRSYGSRILKLNNLIESINRNHLQIRWKYQKLNELRKS